MRPSRASREPCTEAVDGTPVIDLKPVLAQYKDW
jgi:hypothetical protein